MAVSLTFLLILTLITDTDSVTTITKVSVKAGASVSIPCLYDTKYKNNVKYLCEGFYWNSCSYAVKTNSPAQSGRYSIADDKILKIFDVTIKQLTVDKPDYWCAVEIDGGSDVKRYFQLSVTKGTPSLNVTNQEVTGFIGDNITINCHYTTSGGIQWCKLGRKCVTDVSGNIDGTAITINTTVNNVFSVTMSGLKLESSGWYYCVKGDFQMPVHLTVTAKPTATPTTVTVPRENTTKGEKQDEETSSFSALMSLAIPLSVLILIVIVALLILFILKTKHVKVKDSTASKSNEGEVTYSDVSFKKNKASLTLTAASDADVTYSSVVPRKQQSMKRSGEKDEDVTYSTVIHHKQNA